jgi:hypothetical protein
MVRGVSELLITVDLDDIFVTTRAKLAHHPEFIGNTSSLRRLLGVDDFSGKDLSVSKGIDPMNQLICSTA